MSSKYDIATNFDAWTEVGQSINWPNPRAAWYKPLTPKTITLELYTKQLPTSVLYVWYNVSHSNMVVYGSEIAIDR